MFKPKGKMDKHIPTNNKITRDKLTQTGGNSAIFTEPNKSDTQKCLKIEQHQT